MRSLVVNFRAAYDTGAAARSAALQALYEPALPDRAPRMPLLGLLSGFVLALALWSGLAALLWAITR